VAHTTASSAGRLVELRIFADPTADDELQYERDAMACVTASMRRVGGPIVVCTDFRAMPIFRPEFSERLVTSMRSLNSSIERSGVLGNGSALIDLQFVRMIKEAASDQRRRIFTQPESLLEWLDEVLNADERARVREFLAEHVSSTGLPAAAPGGGASIPAPDRRRPGRPG
jgi:hypothetical protein